MCIRDRLLPYPDRIGLRDVQRQLVHVVSERHEAVKPAPRRQPALGLGLRGELGKRPLASEVDRGPVSYTHLDVYKRQVLRTVGVIGALPVLE